MNESAVGGRAGEALKIYFHSGKMYLLFVVSLWTVEEFTEEDGSVVMRRELACGGLRKGTRFSYPVPRTTESTSDADVPSTKTMESLVKWDMAGLGITVDTFGNGIPLAFLSWRERYAYQ